MNTNSHIRIAGRMAAALTGAVIALGVVAAPAVADEVIAVDSSSTVAPAAVPRAIASKPRSITVTNHGGHSVVLFAKGEPIRRDLAPGSAPAVFSGLTAGRTYTIAIGGQPMGAVVALDRPTAASGLTVRTTSTPGTVSLTWRHTATTATGGTDLIYDVTATSPTAPTVRTTVTGVRTATLTGLDTDAVYTFTVAPRNNAGTGKATRAQMTRSLGGATAGQRSDSAPIAEAASVPAAVPTPAAAPAPAPAPAPRPATKTIYVCPDGYATAGDLCQQSTAYTFHTETLTSPYTYHQEQQANTINVPATHNGTVWTWTCPSGYDSGGGQWGVGVCKGTVTATVKDAPPAGYTDNGSSYAKEIQVKDTLPVGWTDNGTQWIRTAAKVAMEVAA